MAKRTFLFLILILLFSCHKKNERAKELLLIATDTSSFINKTELTLKIFSDSTYVFNVNVNGQNYNKVENFKGYVKIKNDSLDFFPSRFEFIRADKANLKNGYIDFIDGDAPFRMKINSTKLKVNNLIDLSKFKNYAVFNYEKNVRENDENLNIDLNEKDIYEIESLLKPEFKKRKNLNEYSRYLKQLIGYKKANGEKYVIIKSFCESRYQLENFRKNVIEMNDGGKCNIFIVLNLTQKKIEIFSVAGLA
ncbi:hypothetical protein [Flavobacterium flabelliforme]|uniref:hypothetical protein n=1 Tax=Flavobacterium flabelliforme TaxID=2816119 RepID=UPI001B32EC76|nr:hypothetical protein [Flavobacterium flabelliforme]